MCHLEVESAHGLMLKSMGLFPQEVEPGILIH